MKVKLNQELLKKFSFSIGGDMSESIAIAVDHDGNPITYTEFLKDGGVIKPIHVLGLKDEFLVVNHDNPINKGEYELFKIFFEKVKK